MVIYSGNMSLSSPQLPVTTDFLLSVLSAFYTPSTFYELVTFMHSGKSPLSSTGYRLLCFCRSKTSSHKGDNKLGVNLKDILKGC